MSLRAGNQGTDNRSSLLMGAQVSGSQGNSLVSGSLSAAPSWHLSSPREVRRAWKKGQVGVSLLLASEELLARGKDSITRMQLIQAST